MYNRTTVQPLGLCQLELCNTKNGKVYQVEFTVLKQDCTPLLGNETTQEMDLIQVRFENILSLDLSSEVKPLTKESLIAKFPDVFRSMVPVSFMARTTWKLKQTRPLLFILQEKFP